MPDSEELVVMLAAFLFYTMLSREKRGRHCAALSLSVPRQSEPKRAKPNHFPPNVAISGPALPSSATSLIEARQSYSLLRMLRHQSYSFPHSASPRLVDESEPQRLSDKPSVALVEAKSVADRTERTEIAYFIRSVLPRVNMINMTLLQRKRNDAMNTSSAAAYPRYPSQLLPDSFRRSSFRHRIGTPIPRLREFENGRSLSSVRLQDRRDCLRR